MPPPRITTSRPCSSHTNHTPGRSSRIFFRTPVNWSRNQCPESSPLSKHFVPRTSFSDVFFPFRWLSMLSSHLSLGLPLGLFPVIFNFITTLSVDSSFLLVTWPNHPSLFLLITWTKGSILLCLYRSSFLFLSRLVTSAAPLTIYLHLVRSRMALMIFLHISARPLCDITTVWLYLVFHAIVSHALSPVSHTSPTLAVSDCHSCQHGPKKMRDVSSFRWLLPAIYHINILRNPNEVDVHWGRNAKPK